MRHCALPMQSNTNAAALAKLTIMPAFHAEMCSKAANRRTRTQHQQLTSQTFMFMSICAVLACAQLQLQAQAQTHDSDFDFSADESAASDAAASNHHIILKTNMQPSIGSGQGTEMISRRSAAAGSDLPQPQPQAALWHPASNRRAQIAACNRVLNGGDHPGCSPGFEPFSLRRRLATALPGWGGGGGGGGGWRCSRCSRGRFSPGGTQACQACAAGGRYAPGYGASICEDCPEGHYSREFGHGNTHCWECRAGYYNNQTQQSTCEYCPLGRFSVQGAQACQACAAGGKYAPGDRAWACEDCPEGHYSHDSVGGNYNCRRCDPGYYNNQTQQSTCEQCSPGTFQPSYGQTMCIMQSPTPSPSVTGTASGTPSPSATSTASGTPSFSVTSTASGTPSPSASGSLARSGCMYASAGANAQRNTRPAPLVQCIL